MLMKKQKNRCLFFIIMVLLLACMLGNLIRGNTVLEVNAYSIRSSRIPKSFDGFRIAQISDLHNAEFGAENARLLELLTQTDPDIIVITGDMIDSRNTEIEIALAFAEKAVQIAPVYYVTGNHEARVQEYVLLKAGLEKAGVMVLENQKVRMTRERDTITLIGIQDPSFQSDYLFGDAETAACQEIISLQSESDGYTILLSHRPELFELYVETGIDLVFSGHAHGGQFRLPFVGGLVAPNQGLFPKYDSGLFAEEHTMMIVSRGLGNSIIPLRINNPPEILVAQLNAA